MSKFLVAVATVTCVVSVAAAVPAVPAVAVSTSAQHQIAADRSPVSDRNVIELFTGQGRIVAEHPELAGYLPSGEQHLTDAQLSAVVDEYRAADPRFHEDVTVPLQSGDPYLVLDALRAFEKVTHRIAGTHAQITTGDGKCLVVLAVGVLVWAAVSVSVKFWGPNSATHDAGAAFAAELARTLR
jgi:SdpC family antimicrobial peptide